ncbi:MAG: hypothetical protein F6K11_14215 [Leptolyngbya sp. SIO3F4]|nr:hypothetical protein [Leptolyngbya sp. SIO3F4]
MTIEKQNEYNLRYGQPWWHFVVAAIAAPVSFLIWLWLCLEKQQTKRRLWQQLEKQVAADPLDVVALLRERQGWGQLAAYLRMEGFEK